MAVDFKQMRVLISKIVKKKKTRKKTILNCRRDPFHGHDSMAFLWCLMSFLPATQLNGQFVSQCFA